MAKNKEIILSAVTICDSYAPHSVRMDVKVREYFKELERNVILGWDNKTNTHRLVDIDKGVRMNIALL